MKGRTRWAPRSVKPVRNGTYECIIRISNRTSPDVAREEANDMMATGRGELYEVVPLYTTPQTVQSQAVPLTDAQIRAMLNKHTQPQSVIAWARPFPQWSRIE